MSRQTRSSLGGFIFIPARNYRSTFKVEITNETTGKTTDMTDYLISARISWSVGKLASSTLVFSNPYGKWLNTFTGGETVIIYGEYGEVVSPSTKLFKGKLDNPYFSLDRDGYRFTIEARQVPELFDIKIVEQYDNKLVTDAIRDIVDNYYSNIVTYDNLPNTDVRFTGNFRYIPGITAFAELAKRANMDVFIDTNDNIELFTKESRNHTTDAISYETNLLSVNKYGVDNTKAFNNIIVFGKEEQNIVLLNTKYDLDAQSTLWRKDNIITDNSLTTMDAVAEMGNIELSNSVNRGAEGSVNVLGMPTIKPGYNVTISVPYCGMYGYKNIKSVTHNLTANGFLTSLQIAKRRITVAKLFKNRIDAEERLKPYSNLNNMSGSMVINFDESVIPATLVNLDIDNEHRLHLPSGETSGSLITNAVSVDGNITQCELRIIVNFPQHELCSFRVSNNGGATWESITPGTLHTFAHSGSEILLNIDVVGDASNNPVFEAICLMYKEVV